MRAQHPETEPATAGLLDVGDGHSVYWECVGNPAGIPAVYLHGGPGAGGATGARRYFDPQRFRTVLFDQRGCGRSRPLANSPDTDLTTNTTQHLLSDIERLREHLGVERWVVAGVSWGVTLALVYAQRHPERVRAMALGAVTTGTRREIDWITRDMGRIFPEAWKRFVDAVPDDERDGDLAAGYARLLSDPDVHVRANAARQWCEWEDTHVSLMPGWTPDRRFDDPTFRAVFARLVTHYWSNGCFLADGQIQRDMYRVADIPAVLIHGRHDISGPLDTAWQLHRAWPASELVIVDDAGHGGGGFAAQLTAALDSIASGNAGTTR